MNSDKLDKSGNNYLRFWLSNENDMILDYQDEVNEHQDFNDSKFTGISTLTLEQIILGASCTAYKLRA